MQKRIEHAIQDWKPHNEIQDDDVNLLFELGIIAQNYNISIEQLYIRYFKLRRVDYPFAMLFDLDPLLDTNHQWSLITIQIDFIIQNCIHNKLTEIRDADQIMLNELKKLADCNNISFKNFNDVYVQKKVAKYGSSVLKDYKNAIRSYIE